MGKLSTGLAISGSLFAKARKLLGSDPTKLAAVLKRTGASSVESLFKMAKDNPISVGLLAYELGDAGLEMMEELRSSHPEIADRFSTTEPTSVAYKPDVVDPSNMSLASVAALSDEFELIDTLSGQFGGFNNLIRLRNFLSMDNSTITAYLVIKGM